MILLVEEVDYFLAGILSDISDCGIDEIYSLLVGEEEFSDYP